MTYFLLCNIAEKVVNKFIGNGKNVSENLKSELNVAINNMKDVEIRQNINIGNIANSVNQLYNNIEATNEKMNLGFNLLQNNTNKWGITSNFEL